MSPQPETATQTFFTNEEGDGVGNLKGSSMAWGENETFEPSTPSSEAETPSPVKNAESREGPEDEEKAAPQAALARTEDLLKAATGNAEPKASSEDSHAKSEAKPKSSSRKTKAAKAPPPIRVETVTDEDSDSEDEPPPLHPPQVGKAAKTKAAKGKDRKQLPPPQLESSSDEESSDSDSEPPPSQLVKRRSGRKHKKRPRSNQRDPRL